MKINFGTFIFGATVLLSDAYSADVAIFDAQKVFDSNPGVIEVRKELEEAKAIAIEELNKFKTQMEGKTLILKSLEKKLKSKSESSTQNEYNEEVRKAKALQDDMIEYDKRARASIAMLQKDILERQLNALHEALNEVAQNLKLKRIINSKNGTIFFPKDEFELNRTYKLNGSETDLTNKVKECFDKIAPRKLNWSIFNLE